MLHPQTDLAMANLPIVIATFSAYTATVESVRWVQRDRIGRKTERRQLYSILPVRSVGCYIKVRIVDDRGMRFIRWQWKGGFGVSEHLRLYCWNPGTLEMDEPLRNKSIFVRIKNLPTEYFSGLFESQNIWNIVVCWWQSPSHHSIYTACRRSITGLIFGRDVVERVIERHTMPTQSFKRPSIAVGRLWLTHGCDLFPAT